MAIKEGMEGPAMFSASSVGPMFGGGDLEIRDNCHMNTDSWSDPGTTYQLPDGYTRWSNEARSLLAGSYQFKCDEYEVFMQQ